MKKNFIYNLIYQILVLILPLITIPYVSRILGTEGIGIYSYTYSIACYFIIIAMLGLNKYGNRTIAQVRDDKDKLSKEFCSIYSLQLITSIIMILCYVLYIILFDNQYKDIAVIQLIYVVSCIFDINWFFWGIEKFKITIMRNTIVKLLSLILIFALVKTKNDLWIYTMVISISTLISNIILFPILKKYINIVKVSCKDILKHLKPNLILFLPVIAVSIYKIMDKIMLGFLANVNEVGYYENAEKIINVPIAIITALGTVMLPKVSNMISNNNEDKVKDLLKKTMPFIMFLAFPMTLGTLAISHEFSIIFFGSQFEKSGYLMELLSITVVFLAWGDVIRTQYLIPKERDKEYVISAYLGAIVNFIANLILIPKYASIGACIGTIIAEFTVVFYQSFVVRRELNMMIYIKKSYGFLIKAIIMYIVVYCVGRYIDDKLAKIITQVIIGGLLYILMNYKYILKDLGMKKYLSVFIPKNN